MITKKVAFTQKTVQYYFDAEFKNLKQILPVDKAIIITDEHIAAAHPSKLKGWKTIIIKAGEEYKTQATVDGIIQQLIALHADRKSILIGVGGGVVTDITGYVASIYMRGISFGFVPTSLLAMVDACIGGKNGIDVGDYKNMVGTINQPQFLLYDVSLLKTLPYAHWRNGFAEIIKHAAIKDISMFKELENTSLQKIQKNKMLLQNLIRRNVFIKTKVVQQDEFEKNERRQLNFGHTLGHALEKQYDLLHGEAVAIGMAFAANLSHQLISFKGIDRLINLIAQYDLPTQIDYDADKAFELLQHDKKQESNWMNFVLLQKIGKATVEKMPLSILRNYL